MLIELYVNTIIANSYGAFNSMNLLRLKINAIIALKSINLVVLICNLNGNSRRLQAVQSLIKIFLDNVEVEEGLYDYHSDSYFCKYVVISSNL
jgi:hypothetical protein